MTDNEQNALREQAVNMAEGRLTRRLRSFVAGRSPDGKHVLLGGLGVLGVGEMWFDYERRFEGYPGWTSASFVEFRP